MGFKEVTTLDADTTVALGGTNRKTGKKNPSQVEGYYLGSRQVESKKSKNGLAYIHFFQTSKGNVGVWGKTDLDRKITTVTPGTMVRASHVGMQTTPNGEMYKYKVEVDSGNTIEVSTAVNPPDLGSDEDYNEEGYSEGYDSDSEDSDSGEVDDSEEAARIAKSNRDRVQALLNGKGKKV